MSTGYILVDSPNPYTAQGTYPRRGGNKLSGTCIVHTSEGAWTAGVDSLTNLVRTRSDYGCYHRACDWADIAQYYPWEWESWQDTETNNWAVGIAAACRTTDWRIMPGDIREGYYRNMARMAADFVTYMREQYGITVPLRRITGAEARARVPGFAAHGDSGISRSDPGADFDWKTFFQYTAEALGAAVQPQSAPTKPKEWDEMASKDDFKAAIREVLTEAPVLDTIALAILKRDCHLVDPSGTSGEIVGTTTLAKKINWMAHNDAQILNAIVDVSRKLDVAHPVIPAESLAGDVAPTLAENTAQTEAGTEEKTA